MTERKLDLDTTHPVLVTGASGYVAGWLVKRLLEKGFRVHAAVRDPSNPDKVAHLQGMGTELPGTLKLFKADLLEDGSYNEAMAGCALVFHTASPFKSRVADPQVDLVDPALKGTHNVLNSVNATETVKRVVLTSSVAAIYGLPEDIAKAPNGILTEAVWNTSSSLSVSPYNYSKTVAEQAAWVAQKAQSRWELVVVNPGLVFGPGTAKVQTSESFSVIGAMATGRMSRGAPNLRIGAVDVRDVAQAHMAAAFIPEAEGRHIIVSESCAFLDIAAMLREGFGDHWPFPTQEAPGEIIEWRADNSKSKSVLGLTYRPVRKAVVEMLQKLVDDGVISPPEG